MFHFSIFLTSGWPILQIHIISFPLCSLCLKLFDFVTTHDNRNGKWERIQRDLRVGKCCISAELSDVFHGDLLESYIPWSNELIRAYADPLNQQAIDCKPMCCSMSAKEIRHNPLAWEKDLDLKLFIWQCHHNLPDLKYLPHLWRFVLNALK